MPLFLAALPVFVRGILVWTFASVIIRLIVATGLAISTYKGLNSLVQKLMDTLIPYFADLPQMVLMIFRLAEVDTAMSIIFSAMLTRVAMNVGMVALGIRR